MNKIERFVIYPTLAVLMILFAFYDLPMMQAMYSQSDVFGIIGELGCEIPLHLLMSASGFWLFRFRKTSKTLTTVLIAVFGLFIAVFFSWYGGKLIQNYLNNKTTTYSFRPGTWFIYPIMAAYLIGGALIAFLPKIDKPNEARAFSFYVIIIYVLIYALMNILKIIWCRPRWRTLIYTYGADEAASYFKPWYIISFNGKFEDLYASFPSGHTMNALAWMILASASSFLTKLKGKEFYIRLAAYLWAALAAVSRTIRGAHFPSDTTAGFLVSFLLIDLMTVYFLPWFRKKLKAEDTLAPVLEQH